MNHLVWILIANYDRASSYVMRVFGHVPTDIDIERAMAELRPDAMQGYIGYHVQAMEIYGEVKA